MTQNAVTSSASADPAMLADDRRINSPQSVTRVIQILEVLCASTKPVSLAQLSRDLNAPKSSIAALVRGLVDADFVVPYDGSYRLGPAAFGLGGALLQARRRLQSQTLVREGMRRVAEQSGETVLFAVRDKTSDTITYIDSIESRKVVRFAVTMGDRAAMYCTAGGRALLSAASDSEVRQYLRRLKPEPLTPQTVIDKRELAGIIATARQSGFAQTLDQAGDGSAGIAAVIQDSSGAAIGALVLAAPSWRMRQRNEALIELVVQEAVAISAALGYRKP